MTWDVQLVFPSSTDSWVGSASGLISTLEFTRPLASGAESEWILANTSTIEVYKARDADLRYEQFAVTSNTSYVQGYDPIDISFDIRHSDVGDNQPAWDNLTVTVQCLTANAVTNSTRTPGFGGLLGSMNGCQVGTTNGSDSVVFSFYDCDKPFEAADKISGSVQFFVDPTTAPLDTLRF